MREREREREGAGTQKNLKESIVSEGKLLRQIEMCIQNTRGYVCVCVWGLTHGE